MRTLHGHSSYIWVVSSKASCVDICHIIIECLRAQNVHTIQRLVIHLIGKQQSLWFVVANQMRQLPYDPTTKLVSILAYEHRQLAMHHKK